MSDDERLSQEFPITSITRGDLITAGLPKHMVKALTDEQMQRIAAKMADYYCDGEFWEHARTATEYVVDRDTQSTGGQHGQS